MPGYASRTFAAPGPTAEEASPTENSGGVVRGAFEVTGYDLTATVNKDHSYDITELISVNIPEQVQSMEFAIPSGNFRITDLEVENTAYSSNKARDASTVAIVDPEKLSQGTHQYTIKYKMREFEDRDSNRDLFYFNALLPEWKQPIVKVSIKIDFPEDFPMDDISCYAGQFGVQDVNNMIKFKSSEKDHEVTVTGDKIPENFAITVKADLPDSYWKGALNGSWVIPAISGILGVILLILIVCWLIGGRDPKISKTTETGPIEGVLPAELGYIFDGEVGIRDIILLIIYFGTKGYLSISEYEPKRYRITRKEDPVSEEKLYRNAYSILFEDIYKGRSIEMEDLGSRLIRIKDAIKDDIAAGYSDAGALSFTPLSRVLRVIGIIITAAGIGISNALSYSYEYLSINYVESIVLACLFAPMAYFLAAAIDRRDSGQEDNRLAEILSGAVTAGVIIYTALGIGRRTESIALAVIVAAALVLAIMFIVIMRARGRENAELVARLRRLRDFIYHPTPRELLEHHLADSNYYYDMLQYALAMGAEESWAMSFLTLKVPEPDWFSDDIEGHAFSNLREGMTTVDYARDIKTFMRTIETAFRELMRREHRR